MLAPDYPVETERLLLRPFRRDDLGAFHAIQSRGDVTRYLYYEPRTAAEAEEALERRLRDTALTDENDWLSLAVEAKGIGLVVGEVVLFYRSVEHATGEIGFTFHPDHGGHGYATEAAEEMLRLGFEHLGLHRIIGRVDARNDRSGRLLERLGMRREAHLRENEWVKGEWTDELLYALLAHEWRDRVA